MATDVAEALRYLHHFALKPVVHRDVKSANVLLSHTLQAKLCDFGLVRDIGEGDTWTQVAGTPGYVDPEYFTSHNVTTKSDVYRCS